MANIQISTRIDADLKANADRVLEQLGMSSADYMRVAFSQLVLQQGVPFEMRLPNAETQAAIDAPIEERLTFASTDEMMAYIEAMPDEEEDT